MLPTRSKAKIENPGTLSQSYDCDPPNLGLSVPRVLDKEKNTLEARGVGSTKGRIVLNLTAADVISFTGNTLSHTILQTKDIPVNIPDSKNGKGWLVPGKLVIFVNPIENIISEAGVFFVDHTIGYAATVTSGSLGPTSEPAPICGIGLDNLPLSLFEPVMQILNSVSIQRQ